MKSTVSEQVANLEDDLESAYDKITDLEVVIEDLKEDIEEMKSQEVHCYKCESMIKLKK